MSELSPIEAARLFPRGVGDPFCPRGGHIKTPTDHRLLWHIESFLAVRAPMGSEIEDMRRDLKRYLNARCYHHWHEDEYEGHRFWQCLWCNVVEDFLPDKGQSCDPEQDIEMWPVATSEAGA